MAHLKLDKKNSDKKYPFVPSDINKFDLKYIEENWKTMSDREIAKKLHLLPYSVKNARVALGFKMHKGGESKIDKSEIRKEELKKALTIDGFTVSEFIKFKGWNISRQGFYLVLDNLGIKLSIGRKRRNIWYFNRFKRLYPQFLNENWINERTIESILEELKIGRKIYDRIIEVFKIKKSKKTGKGETTIKLCCRYCGKEFEKRFASYKQMKNKGQENFFCVQSHYFAYRKED